MKYGTVIFDMDGVILNSLVDDEKWKYDAVRRALREYGVETSNLSKDEMRDVLGDRGYTAVVKRATSLGLNPGDIWRRIAETTTEARIRQMEDGNFELYSGVHGMVETLHQKEVSLGIISNAPEDAVIATIELFDLKQYFKFYAGVRNFEDLHARKPNPNHLELAKAELKRTPFAYVGDAESDILAAKEAEIDSIWVKQDGMTLDASPDYKVDSVGDIADLVSD